MQQEAFPQSLEDFPPFPPFRLEEEPLYGRIQPEQQPAIGGALRGLSPSKRVLKDSDEARKEPREREELREKVLAKRLLLREKRRELRRQREKAGTVEAQLASSIRRFCLQAEPPGPEELFVQFGEVQAERDALGTLDIDYDEAEDEYDALEWTLNHGDDKAPLVAKTEVPYGERFRVPVVQDYLSHIGEAEMLKEELNDLRMEIEVFKPDQAFIEELYQTCADKEERLRQVEEESRRLMQEVMITDPRLKEKRRQSEGWVMVSKDEVLPVGAEEGRPHSEFAVKTIASQFMSWRTRISHWILDALHESSLERAQHKAILEQPSLDNKTWWSLVEGNWSPERGSGNQSHPAAISPSLGPAHRHSPASTSTWSLTIVRPTDRVRLGSAVTISRQQDAPKYTRTVKTV
ncbi:hypothetical protein W97_04847 [Coniosporium apollinis CBS 100218]|uniref:Uncharacterized protein n=1 Tax=Coniosporium apollinis (strain CBS 100218) TaxID=1168221 RepID=R7YUZ6_CONA1|nr:uncharacterized protein W97_04847 [Coniosporium apollinis CBS 100218]EON65609.1 hypothetical protein W97_04847 [Coniosporium apollinis CBS 100218]